MAFNHSANFSVSRSPHILPAEDAPPPPQPPSEVDELRQQLADFRKFHEDTLSKQSKESDKKIQQLVEQTTLLQQELFTRMDQLASKGRVEPQSSAPQSSAPKSENPWDVLFQDDERRPQKPQQVQTQQEQKEDNMDPKEVEKIAARVVNNMVKQGQQAMDEAAAKQKELMDRFAQQDTDLHPHQQQVMIIWNELAKANPSQDMEARYKQTVQTARMLLYGSPEPKQNGQTAPRQQQQTSASPPPPFPRGGQGGVAPGFQIRDVAPPENEFTLGLGRQDLAGLEQANEQQRLNHLEEYARERKRSQQQRLGMFQIPN